MKKIYIDSSSSGEERENQVVTKIKQVDYHNYLLGNILNFKHINNADEFKTKLGLILHNLADRLFKSSIINNTYQNIKATKLSLSTEKYNKILDDIKTVFNKQLNQLFINYNKENPIIDDDYIDLFNFIFDKNLKLPQTFILKDTISIANVREILLKELQNSTINLKPLFKNPLEINSTFNNVGEILSYSKVNTRNIKNTLKYIKIQEANNYNSSTVYKISNSQLEVFTDIHILHYKTSNVQTEKFGFGTYKEIFQEISNNEPYKKT